MKHLSKFLFIILLAFCFIACGKKPPETTPLAKPAHLLTKDEMVSVLVQVHLLEAAVNLQNAKNQTQNRKDTLRAPDLFKKYGITFPEFKENFTYYASQPKIFLSIYDEVLIQLTRLQAEDERKKP
jgi:hypothetical protein